MKSQSSLTSAVVVSVLLSFVVTPVFAYPVFGEIWQLRQPDGSTVDVRIWGDEYYQVVESLDGFTLVRDPVSHMICYASLSADGNQLVSTGIRVGTGEPVPSGIARHIRINREASQRKIAEARRILRRASAHDAESPRLNESALATGDVQGLVVLVDFADQTATIARDDIDNMFNEAGYSDYGNNGSVRDYFHDVSEGALNFTNWVSPAYYRAQYPFTHYDDCSRPWPEGPFELIVEALDYLESTGMDFEQFDSDNDGFIDAFALMFAGVPQCAWVQGMWAGGGLIDDLWISDGGVATGRGLWIGMSDSPGIGGFCHEAGHMVCSWPDLYDYDGDSRGIGKYCLMASGITRTNPVEPCAYLKSIAGWGDVTSLTTSHKQLAIPSSSTNSIFKFEHPTLTNEYYLIENRRQEGRDAEVPDQGLAVWHIDTNGHNSWNQMLPDQHFLVTLVQADGLWDLESNVNSGDDTDLFGAPSYDAVTPCSSPSTHWWDGSESGLYIKNISHYSSAPMTFDFSVNDSTTWATGDVATVGEDEQWDFRVELNNLGVGDAFNVTATITEDLAGLEVPKPSCDYGDIGGGNDSYGHPDFFTFDLTSWSDLPMPVTMNLTWENGCGVAYSDVLALVLQPPTVVPVAIQSVSATVSGMAVEIRWQAFADEPFEGFNVYRWSENRQQFVRLNAGTPLGRSTRRLTDDDVVAGMRYLYTVAALLSNGSEVRAAPVEATVSSITTRLVGIHPNPCNPSTTIDYRIGESTRVTLNVYDAAGRLVRRLVNQVQPVGSYSILWVGTDDNDRAVASGVYFCRLETDGVTQTRRMVLVK